MLVDLLAGQNPAGVTALEEAGIKGFDFLPFTSVFAAAGTPQVVLDRYAEVLRKLLTTPAMRDKFENLGITSTYGSPAELRQMMQDATANWARVIQSTGYQLQ